MLEFSLEFVNKFGIIARNASLIFKDAIY